MDSTVFGCGARCFAYAVRYVKASSWVSNHHARAVQSAAGILPTRRFPRRSRHHRIPSRPQDRLFIAFVAMLCAALRLAGGFYV